MPEMLKVQSLRAQKEKAFLVDNVILAAVKISRNGILCCKYLKPKTFEDDITISKCRILFYHSNK